MGYSSHRARYEASLASAHRMLHAAELAAEDMHSEGEAWDVHMLAVETVRLAQASLSNKPRRVRADQMTVEDMLRADSPTT